MLISTDNINSILIIILFVLVLGQFFVSYLLGFRAGLLYLFSIPFILILFFLVAGIVSGGLAEYQLEYLLPAFLSMAVVWIPVAAIAVAAGLTIRKWVRK